MWIAILHLLNESASDVGGKLMGRVQETGSLIPSLDASNLSYEFEKERVTNPNEQKKSKVAENVDFKKKMALCQIVLMKNFRKGLSD